MPTGLGDEQLWISATNDNTGTSTALNDLGAASRTQYTGSGVTVAADTNEGGTYALSFDGSSTRSWQYTPALQNNGGYFGWSVWFKADAIGSVMSVAGGNSWSSSNGGNILVGSAGELMFNLMKGTSGSANVSITYSASLNAGQWYHVAASGDGTTARLYLDGVEVASASFTGFAPSWKRFMRLGSAGAGAADSGYGTDTLFFDGLIDDARFYDRTLTQAEITHLASSRGVEGPPPVGLGDEQLWLCPSLSGENTNDLSGNGNLTAVQGNISYTANSGEGGSLCFEGDGSTGSNGLKLDSPSSADLPASATYTMWVQAHDLSGTRYLVAGRSTNSENMFDLAIKSPNLRCRINNGGATLFQQSGLLTVNTWHHVSLTRSTDNWELFVDGVSSATGSGTLNSYTQDFTTWMQNTIGSSTLDGYMDDIRVYNRVLTQAEITHLATSRGIEGQPPVGLGDEKLWLCPSLNDSANDISGNGNDGTYQGGMGTVADSDEGGSYAFDFDGVDDYIQTSLTDTSWRSGGTFSVSGWYKSGNKYGFASLLSDGEVDLGQTSNFNRGRADGLAPTGHLNFAATPYPSSGFVWRHFAMVVDSGAMDVYEDGVHQGSFAAGYGTTVNAQSYDARIGVNPYDGLPYSQCRVDDIRAYDRVLTQAEVTHLAEARGIEGPPPVGLGDEKLWLCPSLNDSPNDISGNGNDGTYQGGMGTVLSDGKLAYDFDGVDDEIDLASLNNWNDGTEYSFAMWSLADVTPSRWYPYRATGSGANREYYSNYGDSTYIHRASNGAGSTGNQPSAQLMGTWIHSAVTYDGTTMRLFVDGIEIDSYTVSPLSAATSLRIGNNTTTTAKMDDIRSYNRVLTGAEITHLASQRGVEGPPPVGLGDEQLWLCPSLNDSASDISGNGNDGTYVGSLTTTSDTDYGGSRAYDIDVNSKGVTLPSDIIDGKTEYSMSIWVKLTATPSGNGTILGAYKAATVNTNLSFSTFSGGLQTYGITDTGSTVGRNFENPATAGYWRHLVCTYKEGVGAVIYENGVLSDSFGFQFIFTGRGTLTYSIGKGQSNGTICLADDARIWHREITQAEITHLAEARGIEGPPPVGLGDEQLWLCPSINDSANDISGNGNNGAYQGGMGTVADTGEGGAYAYEFDGSDDYISVLGGVGTGTTDAFCLSFWVNWAGTGTDYFFDMDYPENNALSVYGTTGPTKIQAIARPNSNGSGNTYNNLSTNSWQHVLFRRVAGSNLIQTYIGGVLKSVARTSSDLITLGNDTAIGNNIDGSSLYAFEGMMDDIRWFNKSLTQAEIDHLATSRGIEGSPVQTPRYYDFGPDAAPVKTGYQKVTGAAYDADFFGWGNGETTPATISTVDRGGSDDMERDFCYGAAAQGRTFRDPTVIAGDYTLTAYCHDALYPASLVVYVWNSATSQWDATSINSGSVPAGSVYTGTASITVGENGVQGLYIRVLGTVVNSWILNGIDLVPAVTVLYNPFKLQTFQNTTFNNGAIG